jgi:hypothetical protein
MMRKVVFRKFGPPEVLNVIECDAPTPKSNQVRIRIHATTVTAAEAAMRNNPTGVDFSTEGQTFVGSPSSTRRASGDMSTAQFTMLIIPDSGQSSRLEVYAFEYEPKAV